MKYEDIFSKETMDSLKGKSADSLRQMLGDKNVMQAAMRSQTILNDLAKIEEPYKDELEMIAVQMVKDVYPIIDYADIKIDASLVSMSEVNNSLDEIKVQPNHQLEVGRYYKVKSKRSDSAYYYAQYKGFEDNNHKFKVPAMGNISASNNELKNIIKDFKPVFVSSIDESQQPFSPEYKRRVINGITHGAAVRGSFGFLLFKEYLDKLDPTLVDKYKELMNNVFGSYDSDQAVAMFLSMIQQGHKMGGGSSKVNINEIKVQPALNLIVGKKYRIKLPKGEWNATYTGMSGENHAFTFEPGTGVRGVSISPEKIKDAVLRQLDEIKIEQKNYTATDVEKLIWDIMEKYVMSVDEFAPFKKIILPFAIQHDFKYVNFHNLANILRNCEQSELNQIYSKIKQLKVENIDEIKVVQAAKLDATKRDKADSQWYNDNVHEVPLDKKSTFTLYKQKNYWLLHPSFAPNSPKFAKIVAFLKSKGIQFEEVNKTPGKVFIRIPLKYINSKDRLDESAEQPQITIVAKAICFPMLVHEIIKGLYEILSLQGFQGSKEQNQSVVDKVDKLEHEPADLRLGKFIYDAVSDIYNDSNYDDPRIREYLFTEIYKLSENEFISFIENAINKKLTTQQKSWADKVMFDIEKDMKADDSDAALSEIKMEIPKAGGLVQLGKHKINPSTRGNMEEYTWDEFVKNKSKLKVTITTINNAVNFFSLLGTKPTHVKVETNGNTRNSFYIFGEVDGEPIVLARRESESSNAGQTKVYSKYAVGQLSYLNNGIGYVPSRGIYNVSSKTNHNTGDLKKELPSTKENILKALKIKNNENK